MLLMPHAIIVGLCFAMSRLIYLTLFSCKVSRKPSKALAIDQLQITSLSVFTPQLIYYTRNSDIRFTSKWSQKKHVQT